MHFGFAPHNKNIPTRRQRHPSKGQKRRTAAVGNTRGRGATACISESTRRLMENSRPRLDNQRPRLQRSASERGTLQRSSSLLGLLGRVPWPIKDDDYYSSSGEDEPRLAAAPPSPVVSQEEAKVGDESWKETNGRARLERAVVVIALWRQAAKLRHTFRQTYSNSSSLFTTKYSTCGVRCVCMTSSKYSQQSKRTRGSATSPPCERHRFHPACNT